MRDPLTIIIEALIGLVIAYTIYVVKKIDNNQSRLSAIVDDLSCKLHRLMGEHKMAMRKLGKDHNEEEEC